MRPFRKLHSLVVVAAMAASLFGQQTGGRGYIQSSAAGSQRVVYTSKLLGTTGDAQTAALSSAVGKTDYWAAIQAALNPGNVRLINDGNYALSKTLLLYSGDSIECLSRSNGFIMLPASNAYPVSNAHRNSPTTLSGTGQYETSNIVDTDLAVRHCMINANATEAVTGTEATTPFTPHTVDPSTGLWVFGPFFLGVTNLDFSDNEVYDTGTFSLMVSNFINASVNDDYFHQPLPLVALKNTDGPHFTGPGHKLKINRNWINAGDDALAINPNDGFESSANAGVLWNFVNGLGVKAGPITDVEGSDNYIDYSTDGVRLLSSTELLDRVTLRNTWGTVKGIAFQANSFSSGPGNIGHVVIDGYDVSTDASDSSAGAYTDLLSASAQSLELSRFRFVNPASTRPLIAQTGGNIGLTINGLDIDTTTNYQAAPILFNGGTVTGNGPLIRGVNWRDSNFDSQYLIGGSVVPIYITVSGYSGPNRLLNPSFTPSFRSGDAFSNIFPTYYLKTNFTEGTVGSTIAGTKPAIYTGADTGWHITTGAWTFNGGGGTISATASPGPPYGNGAYIDLGMADYTLNMAASSGVGVGSVIMLRYTDTNNFVALSIGYNSGNTAQIINIVSNVQTNLTSIAAFNIATLRCTVSGANITLSDGVHTPQTATIPAGANRTATKIGFTDYTGTGMIISSMSVNQ